MAAPTWTEIVDVMTEHEPGKNRPGVTSPGPPGEPSYVGERLAAWRRATDPALFMFALASVPLLLLELQVDRLSDADRAFLALVNVVIFSVFFVDYVVELVKAVDRRAFVRGEWLMAVVVLTSAVALIPAGGLVGVARLLRLVRPFSGLVRVVSVGGIAVRDSQRFLRRKLVRSAFGVGVFVWLSSAAAFMLAEGQMHGPLVDGYADALWWSFTAMAAGESTLVEPVTAAGKLIAAFTLVVGLAVFAAVIARVAAFLVGGDDHRGVGRPGVPDVP